MRGMHAVLGAALALTGCFEADVEVRLLADGSGTVRLVLLLPPQAVQGDGDRKLADAAAAHLLSWKGVEAWTALDLLAVEGEDRAQLVATGWASDLSQLRAPLDPAPAIELERAAGKLAVRVRPTSPGWSTLDATTWADQRRALLQRAAELSRARVKLRLLLPGESSEGRSVSRAWEGERLAQQLTDLVGGIEVVRGRVSAGELPAQEAQARESALLVHHLGLEVTATLPADDGGAAALFQQGLAAAREAWERRGAPRAGAAAPVPPVDPVMREAQRELELARQDEERARAEMERWERELEQMNEEEEEGIRAEAAEDPAHARLLVELAPAPPGLQAQLLVAPLAPAQPDPKAQPSEPPQAIGTVLEQGRCDLPGLEPGPWKVTVLVFSQEGCEWSWSREARLVGGGLSRIDFAWPTDGGTLSGKVEPAPGRQVRAWSGDLRVSAPLDQTGAFAMSPLAPGKWRVAVTDGAGPWLEDPAQLPAALEVEVTPGKPQAVAPPGVAWDGSSSRVLWR